jgi:hypothetical protein
MHYVHPRRRWPNRTERRVFITRTRNLQTAHLTIRPGFSDSICAYLHCGRSPPECGMRRRNEIRPVDEGRPDGGGVFKVGPEHLRSPFVAFSLYAICGARYDGAWNVPTTARR